MAECRVQPPGELETQKSQPEKPADLFSAQLPRRVSERTTRMNRRMINTTNMLGVAHRFATDPPLTPPSPAATALITAVGNAYTAMLALGSAQSGGSAE